MQRALAAASLLALAQAVLRYPDGAFEDRSPLHLDECGPPEELGSESSACLLELRRHLLEDTDCRRVICDNIASSTPMEVYANFSDWAPFKNMCGHLQEFFLSAFDLGTALLWRRAGPEDEARLRAMREVVDKAAGGWGALEEEGAPGYGNSTRSVLRRHGEKLLRGIREAGDVAALGMLELAVATARGLQLLIENVSVTLLLNYYMAQLEHSGRVDYGRNLVHEMYGDVSLVNVVFHDIYGKRWDSLSALLDALEVEKQQVTMAEVGVEAANTSRRLLQRNPLLRYVAVDPYINNEALYLEVAEKLGRFEGRAQLLRNTSVNAATSVEEQSLDIVFLDARHDYEAVLQDIAAWRGKVRPGGVLAGHDFSWMFPTVAMAVYSTAFTVPDGTINLAPDGVWWFRI